ncbi:kinase-like protein [Piromyces finnis]|uniref:Kinase-like protein n=1 Tax=Piromyces finnis TaxID=1754191 RepID=A0A1Y1V6V5_9FUNG|nr:kinase-like protein [Piromyces finnis]|eukprot:ORX48075.1 kinase-like protein [Piromyces finnis]
MRLDIPELSQGSVDSNVLLKNIYISKMKNNNAGYFSFLREAETTKYIPTGRSLGTGSFAIAIEVAHIETGKKYVAKIMTSDKLRGYEKGIEKEIQIMQYYSNALSKMDKDNNDNNNNLLRLIDCFRIVTNGQTHICMILDLCDPNDLFDAICDNGAFCEEEAKKMMKPIFEAVHCLHQCGIVHRDIKAENILLKDGKPILADFGLAEFCELGKNTLTEYCGTPGTTAPEIIKNEPYGNSCDMYSLGALTYFLLAGYRPFDWAEDARDERDAVLNNKFSYPEESFGEVSLEAQDFINKCMMIDPNERMTSEEALNHPWLKE